MIQFLIQTYLSGAMGRYLKVCFIFAVAQISSVSPLNDFMVVSDSSLSKQANPTAKGELSLCDYWQAVQWQSDFHGCFMKKKYDDGGENLNSIVDRILEHAEACLIISGQGCRTSAKGFRFVFKKVLEQMKDYSNIYLEAIMHNRKNIKDLHCIEDTLSIETYERCLGKILNVSENEIDSSKEKFVQENLFGNELKEEIEKGLICANRRFIDCSEQAISTLNKMVRKMFGIDNPTKPTTTPAPLIIEKAEKPWRWYDYVIQPFISAWNWVKGLFG